MSDLSDDFSGDDELFNWDNSDQDYLSGETDTEPTYLGSVQFMPESPGAIEGHMYTDGSDLPLGIGDLDLKPLAELLGLEGFEPAGELFFEPLPPDFDFDNPDVRGPFFDDESVNNWLNDTGLFANATVYFDEDTGEYWVEIGETP